MFHLLQTELNCVLDNDDSKTIKGFFIKEIMIVYETN